MDSHFEYLLLISAPANLNQEMGNFKNEFRDRYGCTHAAKLKPHCTLMHFVLPQNLEPALIKQLEVLVKHFLPVPLSLNGFGQYPSHTIYIKVEDDKKLYQMVKMCRLKLKPLLSTMELFKPTYLSDPHFTIARRMTVSQFEQAWADWGKRKFNASFTVQQLSLFKRPLMLSNPTVKHRYERMKDFKLSGQRLMEVQLGLF